MHRCGYVTRVRGREFKCPRCGLIYNRDLNGAINIAHALKRRMGWGSREPPNQQMRLESKAVKAG
ncbi:MAG: zinc ribbon domain-containing protein [Candidatus Asgardarchaeia archaeon]